VGPPHPAHGLAGVEVEHVAHLVVAHAALLVGVLVVEAVLLNEHWEGKLSTRVIWAINAGDSGVGIQSKLLRNTYVL
jgi:hypothetical protein